MGILDAEFRSYSIYLILLCLSLALALFSVGGYRHSFNDVCGAPFPEDLLIS